MILLLSALLIFLNSLCSSTESAELGPERSSWENQSFDRFDSKTVEAGGHYASGEVEDPEHERFSKLLSKHVSREGIVDYKGWKKDESELDLYLSELSASPIDESWSRDSKLAYWINVYNAFTIKLILKNMPVSSIMDIAEGKPWDLQWIQLGNKTYSLNQIENEIIRPEFGEPRIHFAVNCAAKSCPPLANKAFTEENLEVLLESQTKSFVNSGTYNSLANDKVVVSKIFDWYSADFTNIVSFLNQYAAKTIDADAEINYQVYNWSLNN